MKTLFFCATLCAVSMVVGGFHNRAGAAEPKSQSDSPIHPAPGSGQTARIARAAQAVLDTLDEEHTSDESAGESILDKLLEKFPEFDPSWSAEVQAKWFEAFGKLQDQFKA